MRIHFHPWTKVLLYILCIFSFLWILYSVFLADHSLSARQNTAEEVLPRIRYKHPHHSASDDSDPNKIPTIIHQTWKSEVLPLLFKPWMLSWLKFNKDWEYWFWTDEDIRRLISIRFPQFLEQFDNYPPGGYRPDVFRYFALYEFGGVYADLDMECLRSLYPITWQYECILSQEPLEHAHFLSESAPPLVSNAFMACRPRHDFFKSVIGNLPKYAQYVEANNVLEATGPFMLTKEYKEYKEKISVYSLFSSWGNLVLAKPDEFHPTVDNNALDSMREHCVQGIKLESQDSIELHKTLCKKLLDMKFDNSPKKGISYTVHYWTHSWAGPKYDPWNIYETHSTFHVGDIQEFHDKHPE